MSEARRIDTCLKGMACQCGYLWTVGSLSDPRHCPHCNSDEAETNDDSVYGKAITALAKECGV